MKRFLLLFLFTLALISLFFAGKVYAADPIPEFGRIDCPDFDNEKSNPNFNSSRPYQASPCGDAPKAVMCGNSLQIIEDTPSVREPLGTEFSYKVYQMQQKSYIAKLTEATFPIAGNTELTRNSTTTEDEIDDATKVNEYLNWYLNGINNRAEYGETKNTDYETVNLSGPVQKLLPGAIQDAQRLVTIRNLYESADYAAEEPQNPGDHPGPTQLEHDEAITHDQIVVCTKNAVRILPLWLTNILDLPTIGAETPTECYPNPGLKADGSAFRLNMWNGQSDILALINRARDFLPLIFPQVPEAIFDGAEHWPKNYPPLPWSDEEGKPFETDLDYQKAYNEWRGQLCTFLELPILGRKLICVGAWPVITNPYADLYPYVPLSNTVDKNAHTPITGVGINGIGGTEVELPNIAYSIEQEPVLMYPHTAEVSELSDLLNTTYIPKEGTTSDEPTDSTEPLIDPVTNKCRIVDLRTNPGDNLFPDLAPSEVNVVVFPYTVTRRPCHDVESNYLDRAYASCRGQVAIEIRMVTKVPYAKEIFDSTTAGADSTFRRIYPKVEEGAPVTCIANIPSVTNAQYVSVENMDGMKVIGPLGDNTTDNPQLYFPHFGSVYDYFLKGIQTALRPKGYGEATPISGTLCANSVKCGELPALPKASGSCNLGSISSSVGGIPQSLKDIISAAADTYKVPPNLILGVMYGEGLFDGSNKKDWTDENVKNWSTCQPVPGCSTSGDDHFMGFNGNDWTNIAPHIKDDLLKLDPNRQEPSQCNLLDAIYGEAWNLHDSADGGMDFQCFGLDLNAPIPTSCTWNANQYESAIKIAENGYDRGCFTLKGSCATGGGNAALCNNGVDGCEKYFNAGNTSHNACVWDVAHGN